MIIMTDRPKKHLISNHHAMFAVPAIMKQIPLLE